MWALLRPRRALAAGAAITMAVGTGAGLLAAVILGRLVDAALAGQVAIAGPVTALAAIAVVHGVGAATGGVLVARLGESALAQLREQFVERALALPLARIEAAGAGDLTSRVTRDITAVAEAVRYALPTLVRSSLSIGLTLVALAALDWRFLAVALLAAPIQIWTVRRYTRDASPVYAAGRVAVGAQQQQLVDAFGGAATVRAHGLEASRLRLITDRSRAAVDLSLRGIDLLSTFFSRLNLAEFVALAGVLAVGYHLVRADAVTVGVATTAALYLHNLFNPMNAALGLADEVQVARASLARIVGAAHVPGPVPAVTPVASVVPLDVQVAGVDFHYGNGRPALRGIDLWVRAGETVALVGASGAGKSTLAALVAAIRPPTAGAVSVDGDDLATLTPHEARRRVALISQETHVFAGPLRDDLRLARPDADDETLRGALATVGARWPATLPEGLDTVVGEGGHRLTSAQSQQLALARLVLADPPVAVLDEATADAGSAGAAELERAAAKALAGRTAIVVAHRLTQAAAADRVVVLDDGRIVEQGPHAELVAAGGRYARLWSAWSTHRSPTES
ncbi:ABC transporter ATP-binding protein [Pilimelia columellifera]